MVRLYALVGSRELSFQSPSGYWEMYSLEFTTPSLILGRKGLDLLTLKYKLYTSCCYNYDIFAKHIYIRMIV